jgi:hypothetical protein
MISALHFLFFKHTVSLFKVLSTSGTSRLHNLNPVYRKSRPNHDWEWTSDIIWLHNCGIFISWHKRSLYALMAGYSTGSRSVENYLNLTKEVVDIWEKAGKNITATKKKTSSFSIILYHEGFRMLKMPCVVIVNAAEVMWERQDVWKYQTSGDCTSDSQNPLRFCVMPCRRTIKGWKNRKNDEL